MEFKPVVVLLTKCGPLQIYNSDALRAVVEALPRHCWDPLDIASGSTMASSSTKPNHAANEVIDGWNIEQWRQWGRKKSALASNICKLNGILKAQIADSAHGKKAPGDNISADSQHDGPGQNSSEDQGADPFATDDPWASYGVHDATANSNSVNDIRSARQPKRVHRGENQFPIVEDRDLGANGQDRKDRERASNCRSAANKSVVQERTESACGDWHRLPSEAFKIIYDRFPHHPFTVTPRVYVEQRWPSFPVLFQAASHWKEYGPSATLPAYMNENADKQGCREELTLMRVIFRDAWRAKVRAWNDRAYMWK